MTGKVTVASRDFIQLFEAAAVTASTGKEEGDAPLRCVYLASATVDGAEGGTDDVLVAVSGDALVAGQTTIPADGRLTGPALVDIKANAWVKTMVKNAMTNMKKIDGSSALCEVEISHANDGSPGPGSLFIQTITDGVPGVADIHANLPLADVSEYPIIDVTADLTGKVHASVNDEDGNALPDGKVMGFSSSQSKVMKDIGGVFGETVLQYPLGHSAARRVLTCGENWRGTVPGYQFNLADADGPAVELIDLLEDSESETDADAE